MNAALYTAPTWLLGLVAYVLLVIAICAGWHLAKQVSWRDEPRRGE